MTNVILHKLEIIVIRKINYLNILVFCTLILINSNYSFGSAGKKEIAMPMTRPELFLNTIMNGDSGHAGGIDALIMMLARAKDISPNITSGNSLDMGCGFGSDTNFAYRGGLSKIWGIDIDDTAIKYAQEHYPDIAFKKGDALKINDLFEEDFFDFVYLLNVASEIRDKPELFQKLKVVCKRDSLIAILDFSLKDKEIGELNNLNRHTFHPIDLEKLSMFLKVIGLEIIEVVDVTSDYVSWYSSILSAIDARRSLSIAAGYTEDEIGKVETFVNERIKLLTGNKLGGVLIFLRKV